MSSQSAPYLDLTGEKRFPALREFEDFTETVSENLEPQYSDVEIWPEFGTIRTEDQGEWSEVSETYRARSDRKKATFEITIRDYYEDPDIPFELKQKAPDHENIRELKLEYKTGDKTFFNLIADEIYEELEETQEEYERNGRTRKHHLERPEEELV